MTDQNPLGGEPGKPAETGTDPANRIPINPVGAAAAECRVAADPLVDELGLTPALLGNLRNAGISTIAQLQAELRDEGELKRRVPGCGAKTILRIKNALVKRAQSSTVPMAPSGVSADPQSSGGAPPGSHKKPRSLVVTLATFLIIAWVIALLVGLTVVQWIGATSSMFQQQLVLIGVSFIIVFILFALFKSSKAFAEGECFGVKIWIAGPVAAWIGVYGILWKTTPNTAYRTVQVYLTSLGADVGEFKTGQFKVKYRRPNGKGQVSGDDGAAVIQDIPKDAKELAVDSVECFGFMTAKRAANESAPWIYKLTINGDSAEVSIPMVKVKPIVEQKLNRTDVRAILDGHGIRATTVSESGLFTKDKVSLTIENASDRPITFVAFDCVAAFGGKSQVDESGRIWWDYIDERNIQVGAEHAHVWGNFVNFQEPNGWFALFVQFAEAVENKERRQFLGVYNLFKVRNPKVVITRTTGNGVEFEVKKSLSRLE